MSGYLNEPGGISVDRYDLKMWDRLLEESPRVREAKENEPVAQLTQDVWASLYKASPQLAPDGPVVNQKVMAHLMQQSAWRDVRQTTMLDEYSAALGTLDLQGAIEQALPEDVREQARQVQALEQSLRDLLERAQAYDDVAPSLDDPMSAQAQADALRTQAHDVGQQLAQASGRFAKAYDAQIGTIGRALRQALEQAAQQAQVRDEQMRVWGIGAGDGKPVSGKERLELARVLQTNAKVREIARLAGRMQQIALRKRKNRTLHPPTEVTAVTMGDDLAHVLPSELVKLADPETEDLFWLAYAETRLLQYELQGFAREGQGPIVVCVDESGSAKGPVEIWEKGIALALYAIARREKRPFAVVHFGSQAEIQVETWERPQDATPAELVRMAQHFFDGGTDFEAPLREALAILEQSAFAKGDIVFLTDGECEVGGEFLAGDFARVKRETGFQVISVVIGYHDASVRPFSDHIAKPQKGDDATLDFIVEALQ